MKAVAHMKFKGAVTIVARPTAFGEERLE